MRLNSRYRDSDVNHAQRHANMESVDAHNQALTNALRYANCLVNANTLPNIHATSTHSRTKPHSRTNPNRRPHGSCLSNGG